MKNRTNNTKSGQPPIKEKLASKEPQLIDCESLASSTILDLSNESIASLCKPLPLKVDHLAGAENTWCICEPSFYASIHAYSGGYIVNDRYHNHLYLVSTRIDADELVQKLAQKCTIESDEG